jgi:hypothetical protein
MFKEFCKSKWVKLTFHKSVSGGERGKADDPKAE